MRTPITVCILDRDDIHAIMLLTRVNTRTEIIPAALEAGKHVFTQKPFALTNEDAEFLAQAAEAHGQSPRLQLHASLLFAYPGARVESCRRAKSAASKWCAIATASAAAMTTPSACGAASSTLVHTA